MEKTYWVLTHKETGNVLHQSIAETEKECIDIGCAFFHCSKDELEQNGHIVEKFTLVKKPK